MKEKRVRTAPLSSGPAAFYDVGAVASPLAWKPQSR